MQRTCWNCGTVISRSATVCTSCGAEERPQLVDAVLSDFDPSSGDATVKVSVPQGAKSVVHGDQGQYSITMVGVGGVGAQAEGRIAGLIRDSLRTSGIQASIGDGVDERGEDRTIRVPSGTFGLQVTVAPNAPSFFREAHISSASTRVGESHAIEWLRSPIEAKALHMSAPARKNTVLAIDVTHAGVIADPVFLGKYINKYGCPSKEFGFASVWVVGPQDHYCRRLGHGFP